MPVSSVITEGTLYAFLLVLARVAGAFVLVPLPGMQSGTEIARIVAGVAVTFRIKEGPTVKVGKIVFDGNQNLSDRTLRAAMKNLTPFLDFVQKEIGNLHADIVETLGG